MDTNTLALYAISSLLLAATPGPTMLLALSNGMSGGLRVAVFGILGASLGSSLLITGVAFGLGSLLATSEALFNALRWFGVVYLCWLGWKLWRTQPLPLTQQLSATRGTGLPPRTAFLRSLGVALSNPKAILFFAAFLPQFIQPSVPQGVQFLWLGVIFVVIDTLVMVAYAQAGARLVNILSLSALRLLNRACAAGMWLLAGTLAVLREH